jgi:hypothetical protein
MTTRLAPLALAVLAAGCTVDNSASIQPSRICSIPDSCSFEETCDAQPIGVLALDVSLQDEMFLGIEVHNQLQNNEDLSVGRVNTHDAELQTYTTEYETSGGVVAPSTSGNAQQLIPAEGTAVVGIFPITAPLGAALQLQIPASTPFAPVYAEVIAKVRLKGIFKDESDFETGEFRIPIRVCNGCFLIPTCEDTAQVPTACGGIGQEPQGAVTCVTP